MRTETHPLPSPSLGTQHTVTSFHFGQAQAGGWPRKVYIQSSLHAGEIPGMLVAHLLRQRLTELEQQGWLQGEIVLVPMANPIGLAQQILHHPVGRFDLASGENFNRYYREPSAELAQQLKEQLGDEADQNRQLIRSALRQILQEEAVRTELASLRQTLHLLAHDADLVIDLHCEDSGPIHIYAHSEQWPRVEALARYLRCEVQLMADAYGSLPFDEAIFQPWARLRAALPDKAIPFDSVAVTVELRGEGDVNYQLAQQDCQGILDYLVHSGLIAGEVAEPPALLQPPSPLDGSETLEAPHAGVAVLLQPLGSDVQKGDPVADVIDPLSGQVTTLKAGTSGRLYMFARHPYLQRGDSVARIAGFVPLNKTQLLGA